MQAGVTRFIADADGRGQRERIGEVVSSALAVLSVTALVAVAILLTLSVVGSHLLSVHGVALQNDLHLLFVIFAAEAVFGLPALAFLGVLQGLQRYGWIKVVDLSRQILFTVLALTVLLTGHDVVAFGVTMVAATAFAAVGYAVAAHVLCPEMRVSPQLINRTALRPLASFSAWVFISRINGVIWAQMDTVILSVIVGINVLAGYNFAARLQSAASYPQSLSAAAVVPASANLLALEFSRAPSTAPDPRHALLARTFPAGHDRRDDPRAPTPDLLGGRVVRELCGTGATLSHVSARLVHRRDREHHAGRDGTGS